MSNTQTTAPETSEDVLAAISAATPEVSDEELLAALSEESDTAEAGELNVEEAIPAPPVKKGGLKAKKEAAKAKKAKGGTTDKAKAEPKEPKAPRKTVINSKRSEVALDRMGANAEDFVLETTDAKLKPAERKAKRDALLAAMDSKDMAVKVSEKAINLIAFTSGAAKLSTYTEIAIKFLVDKGSMTAQELINHLQDQKANGVKGYSKGTANSQGHQMFKLLPLFMIGTLDGKTMKVNKQSIIAKLVK